MPGQVKAQKLLGQGQEKIAFWDKGDILCRIAGSYSNFELLLEQVYML